MATQQILVLGGGFAGLWAALGAARKLDELGIGPERAAVTLVNRDAYHNIRVRNYEADLSDVRLPLDEFLGPAGVTRIEGDVIHVDPAGKRARLQDRGWIAYDRLVFALGSRLVSPDIPGLTNHAFDVDTFDEAAALDAHLRGLDSTAPTTVVVVGAGLTGIETATEMPGRLRALAPERPVRVILMDHQPHVGSDMGESARPVIDDALRTLGIETRVGVQVTAVTPNGVTLAGGEHLEAGTVVWCAGMRAHPLAANFPVERDRFGRLPVDEFLRVQGVPDVFAAGDVAAARVDGEHASVMSCQHGRPMGRHAGHNVVAELFGQPMLPLEIKWYVTVLDLGPAGAVYTEGWNRQVVAVGDIAKRTKQMINCQRIYPPRTGRRADILAAAAPVIQTPPK